MPTFSCANCGQIRATSEKAPIDWLGQATLVVLTRTPVAPVCTTCARQVRWVGRVSLGLMLLFAGLWLFGA